MGKNKERVCHICGTQCPSWCPTCVKRFATRRNANEMTADERAQEAELLFGPAEIPPEMWFQRLEELVGRPLKRSLEIGSFKDSLVEEARTRIPVGNYWRSS